MTKAMVTEARWLDFRRRTAALRAQLADIADKVADEADVFAAILEQASSRGDAERRLGLAEREREISRIERRNADRLRRPGPGRLQLEPLPGLTGPPATFTTSDGRGCPVPVRERST
jgi:hypothetical protein